MPRIRTIKPEFFTSEDIVSLSPLARLLYIALWCEADKEGRLVWKPMTFKLRYVPGDNCDIHELCKEILDRGLVKLYGEGLAFIPSFSAHQHINPRESASQLPDHKEQPRVGTRQPRVGTSANLDVHPQVGREGKGREGILDASRFSEFWSAYPKKVGKDAAVKQFTSRKIDDALLAEILTALAIQKQSPGWQKDGGQFIPNPATWLSQGRWQDEAVSSANDDPYGLRSAI